MKKCIGGAAGVLLIISACGLIFLQMGFLSFNADNPPSALETRLAMAAVDASLDRHAPELKNPLAGTDADLKAGAEVYLNHCAGCHGLPANPDPQFGRSFNPPVPAFFKEAPDMPENQNFYVTRHGIRWTGMPAWDKTLDEKQTWQVVTFLSHIEKLPPAAAKVLAQPGAR